MLQSKYTLSEKQRKKKDSQKTECGSKKVLGLLLFDCISTPLFKFIYLFMMHKYQDHESLFIFLLTTVSGQWRFL